MSYHYGRTSSVNLETCHEDIITVFHDVIQIYDCSVLCGRRGEEAQRAAFASGASKVDWPDSKHNTESGVPSDAIDATPFPIPQGWGKVTLGAFERGEISEEDVQRQIKELHKFYQFAGIVIGMGRMRGIEMRWGGDWNGDRAFNDQTFDDLVHFWRHGYSLLK